MKVLIHSNGPHVPTGYGKQARLAGQILRGLGHEVAFSCFSGLGGQPIKWDGYTLFPGGMLEFGVDVLIPHARTYGADLVVTLMDTWKLAPCAADLADADFLFAPLVITDCTAENGGPGIPDQQVLQVAGGMPAVVSAFGQQQLAAIGINAPMLPHCYDGQIYKPMSELERESLRADNGTHDRFVIGIDAANSDFMRKGWQEQFAAFQRFSRRHPDALLNVFTVFNRSRGLNLAEMAHDFGIAEKVLWMPVYEQVTGLLGEEFMNAWFNSIDVLSACSYAEGFCIPALEAQACGVPVVATDCSALSELARPAGWLVKGSRYWNPVHRAWWTRPDENAIVRAWEKAYQEGPSAERRERAASFAAGYEQLIVRDAFWAPFMKRIEDAL